jgi:hypothetical protein
MSAHAEPLAKYLASRQACAFSWESANCCHFGARWLFTRTGSDPMAGLPSTPNRLAARRLIRKLGGSLVAVWTGFMGRPPISPGLAQIGDIVLVPVRDGGSIGICAGRDAVVVDERGRLVYVPMSVATHAWRLEVSAT